MDGLEKNYFALYLCIVKGMTVDRALVQMGIRARRLRKGART